MANFFSYGSKSAPQLGRYSIATAATGTAIDVGEVKTHLKISASTEDTYLTNLISVATEMVQNYTGQILMSTTYDLKLPYFINRIDIQRVPVTDVSLFTYYNSSNGLTTITASDYSVTYSLNDTDSPLPTTIIPAENFTYPDTYPRMDAVTIRFVAGYSSADDVPMAIKQAMLLIIGQLYLNRTDMVYKMPVLSEYLLNPYRLGGV
jgi:uncharacterized phiE125 gp8 family phage protein